MSDVITTRRLLRTGRAAQIRRAAGLSQAELAARLGVTQTTIKSWELGRMTPRQRYIEPLGALLVDLAREMRMEL